MILLNAIFIGLIGSFHCIGMCGPIVLVLPTGGKGEGALQRALLYHIGRVITYASFGLVMGLVGASFRIANIQQYTSIIIGVFLVLSALLLIVGFHNAKANQKLALILNPIKNKLGILLTTKQKKNHFFIGLLNGFLPCGLVYFALASSLLSSSVIESVLFMMLFGIGTIPGLLTLVYFKDYITNKINLSKVIPYALLLTGIMLFTRGLNLGIPYLSPQVEFSQENKEVLGGCCANERVCAKPIK